MKYLLVGLLLNVLVNVSLGQSGTVADSAPSTKWNAAMQAFAEQDAEHPPQAGGVLFTGSSSIRLWNLKESFPELDAVNRGFGGSEIIDSVEHFDRLVVPHAPRVVVFYAGDNDIAKGTTPETVHANFKLFVDKLHAAFPKAKLVYIPIKPSLKRWNLIAEGRAANALIQATCEENDRLTFLPIEAPMLNRSGEPRPELFAADGLHLSAEGYELWSALLRPHLGLAPKAAYARTGTNVFASGTLPDDGRLRPLRTLNDRYHPWTPPTSVTEFDESMEQLRLQILVSNGLWPLPEKTALEPVIHGRLDLGDYTVEKVYFATRPGLYLTGNLYRPKEHAAKIPGILCPHGHWANGRFYDSGTDAAQQIESGAEQFEAGAHSPLQARMVQLARMGCTVFHYDMVGYADQPGIDHRTGFNDVDAALRLHSKMGLQTWNSLRALDFIAGLPEVDPNRIAVTGASGGGTQTFILCALDSRPAACFPAVMVGTSMQGGCNCENAHYLRIDVNNVAFAAAFAPRPMALSGADDWTIDIETKGLPELKQVYALFGATDLVQAKCYPQFGHNYNQHSREQMYAWFRDHLDLGDVAIKQSDFRRLEPADMQVFDATHPVPADVLDGPALREVLSREAESQLAALETDEDYQNVVGGAVGVMLAPGLPTAEELQVEELSSVPLGQYTLIKGTTGYVSDGGKIPTVVLLQEEKFNGSACLWFDGRGKQQLFGDDDQPRPEVAALLDQGYAVISADLFLTGEYLAADSPLRYMVNEQDACYTFCYNRPLISHRVRDILAVMAAVRDHEDIKSMRLIGTGDAGLWTLLARSCVGDVELGTTDVDLQGFHFADVQDVQDPNLLPGAVKYGDVPGFVRLVPTAKITLHGTESSDWTPLQGQFKTHGGELSISTTPLAP